MKQLLLSAAAVLAIATPAAAETTGAVGVSYNSNEYEWGGEYEFWDIEGSVFHRVAGPWAVQAEGRYEEVDYGGAFDDDGDHLALHGLYAADTFTAGVFYGTGALFGDFDFDIYGVEGAFRVANWTLEASGTSWDRDSDYARYHVGAKYFFGDNFSVGGRYAFTDRNGDWTTYDIGADYRFASLPIVLSANYLHQDGDFSFEVDTWSLGARWEFGSSSLREADRTAPIADIRNFMNDLRRWD